MVEIVKGSRAVTVCSRHNQIGSRIARIGLEERNIVGFGSAYVMHNRVSVRGPIETRKRDRVISERI